MRKPANRAIAVLLILFISTEAGSFFCQANSGSGSITFKDQASSQTQIYGLNINFFDNPTGNNAWKDSAWITGLVESGAKWVRFESRYYNKTIFETNSSKLNLAPLEMCKLAKQNGLKTLAMLDEKVSQYGKNEFSPITNLEMWRGIVQGQLDGYGPYLDAVEMWNEPDLVNQTVATGKNWYMDGSPEHYVDMLKVVYQEVQAYNTQNSANIKVVAGALGTVRTLDSTEPWDSGGFFLQNIVNFSASLYCDYFSIHIYDGYLYPYSDTEQSEGLFNAKDAYLKAQSIVGEKPIWVTELGANHAYNTTAQAQFMNISFTHLKQTDCPLIFWYCYYNPRNETDPNEAFHGLVNQDNRLTRRETYSMFQHFTLNTQDSLNPTNNPYDNTWVAIAIGGIIAVVAISTTFLHLKKLRNQKMQKTFHLIIMFSRGFPLCPHHPKQNSIQPF